MFLAGTTIFLCNYMYVAFYTEVCS